MRAELVGSHDHIAVGCSERTPVRSVERNSRPIGSERWSSWQVRFEEAYRNEVTGFLEAVAGAADSGAGVRDAVEAHRIVEAARMSLEQGLPVMLKH